MITNHLPFLLFIIIVFLCVPTLQDDPGVDYFFIKDNKIYDSQGGMRIFHGVNVVPKEAPYYPRNIGPSNFTQLKNLGLNGIRLGLSWIGAEPTEGKYDQNYFRIIKDFVNEAGKYGIYTLIEYHQDLFSRQFCGNGAPLWLLDKETWKSFAFPLKLDVVYENQTNVPTWSTCHHYPWAEYYLTKASNKAFGELWTNKNKMFDKFQKFWMKVAQIFKDNRYVIGFELMNQPWPGNAYKNPLVMVPNLSEKIHLQRAYDRLAAAIRSIDPSRNIGFEPVTWLQQFPSGFSHPPGGMHYSNKSIFCYHYYQTNVLNKDGFSAQGFFKARHRDTIRLGTGGILSQFFITSDAAHQNVFVMDICDKYSNSWLGWQYKPNLPLVDEVKRVFAQRVAGNIISQQFNYTTKSYSLAYFAQRTAGITRIYVGDNNSIYGKQGYNLTITPRNIIYKTSEYIYIDIPSDQVFDNMKIELQINKRSNQMTREEINLRRKRDEEK